MHDQYQNNPSQQANVPTHQFATVTKVESDLPRHFSEELVYTDNDIATNEVIMSAMESLKMKKSLEIYNTAKDNMETEKELKSLQDTVEDLHNSLKQKVSAYTELQKKQIELCKPADVKTTIKKLMIAKRATYNESEDIKS